MAPDGTRPSNWLQLSPELWGLIFLQFQPGHRDTLNDEGFRSFNAASFYRLSEVCKTFHKVFLTDPRLHTSLYLGRKTRTPSLASLARWLHKHRASIQTLAAGYESPGLEAVLALLIDAPVTSIHLANVSHLSLNLLTEFKFVTKCTISGSRELHLESTLGALPNLTSLTLKDGDYMGINSAVNLTSLTLQNCNAFCSTACGCVTSLVQLQLVEANIHHFHQRGLCACAGLQYLKCASSRIGGRTKADCFCLRPYELQLPSDLSVLTALTKLEFQTANHGEGDVVLAWLTTLRSLKSISAHVIGQYVVLPEDLGSMINIKTLQVLCDSGSLHRACLTDNLDWKLLVSLESLSLSSPYTDHRDLNGLSSLKSLKYIKYTCLPGGESTRQLIDLSRRLDSSGPCIDFDYEDVYD